MMETIKSQNEKEKNQEIQNREDVENITLESFNIAKKSGKVKDIVDFHSRNKYLFMTFDPLMLKDLGNIVANRNNISVLDLFDSYEEVLSALLSKQPTHKNRLNAIEHMFGYFKKFLQNEEKEIYVKKIRSFAKQETTYHQILIELKELAKRFNQDYLLEQNIFYEYDTK